MGDKKVKNNSRVTQIIITVLLFVITLFMQDFKGRADANSFDIDGLRDTVRVNREFHIKKLDEHKKDDIDTFYRQGENFGEVLAVLAKMEANDKNMKERLDKIEETLNEIHKYLRDKQHGR